MTIEFDSIRVVVDDQGNPTLETSDENGEWVTEASGQDALDVVEALRDFILEHAALSEKAKG